MMAIVLTVMGMLLFFGAQGLPDPAFRAFPTHPAFRPASAGGARLRPAGASSRLDAAAVDALVGMQDPAPPSDPEPPVAARGSWPPGRRWFSQRPW
jgi:hypothetical protein